jgi:hypothetical protein
VFCSLSVRWVGGSGCIEYRHSLTSSRASWVKVSAYSYRRMATTHRECFSAIGRQLVNCASDELVQVNPPSGLNCSTYMDPFISFAGGYITNPDATAGCLYCPYRTTDEFMSSNFNIQYSHHWRNLGILLGVVVFNVRFFYLHLTLPNTHSTDSRYLRYSHLHIYSVSRRAIYSGDENRTRRIC